MPVFVTKNGLEGPHSVVLDIEDGENGISVHVSDNCIGFPSAEWNFQTNQLLRRWQIGHASNSLHDSNLIFSFNWIRYKVVVLRSRLSLPQWK
mmetsp:Transcript_30774/g.65997  ORF Transcript_30774/g.65997 Transcript_30774/m.65997 type:complete len:93 (-) Transcript_30774:11-289(-)